MKRVLLSLLVLAFTFGWTSAVEPKTAVVSLPAVPLRFEARAAHRFVSRGTALTARVTPDRVEILVPGGDARVLELTLEGSSPDRLVPEGEEELPFRTSYFRSAEGRRWVRGARSFRRVRRPEVYPGVDQILYGTDRELEFDFEVRSQADPSRIRMLWSGADSVVIDGDLVLRIGARTIRVAQPRAYQKRADGREVEVSCRFRAEPGTPSRVGFELGDYDTELSLTIDPVVSFSSLFGWAQADTISAIAEDAEGHVLIAGWTNSINLPTDGTFQEEKAGGRDAFVARLSADRSLDWITYLGGAGDDEPSNLALDEAGNVYVVGSTRSSDFPTADPFQATYGGGSDAFLFKLDPTGSTLVFSSFLGGSSDDVGLAIAVGQGSEPIIAGTTRSSNLPVTAGVFQPLSAGGTDAFLSRFTADGKHFVFSTLFGGANTDTPSDVVEKPDGSVWMIGTTSSTDLPLAGALQEERAGSTDAFLTRFSADATELEFSTYLGGRSNETGYCLALDADGSVTVGGETSSSDFPLIDPIQSVYAGQTDVFVARLAADDSGLTAATYFGGSGQDSLRECRMDDAGRLVGVGVTSSPDLPLSGAFDSTISGADLFLAIFDVDRASLAYSSYFGGEGTDIPSSLWLGDADRLLVAGATASLQFPKLNPLQQGAGGPGVYRTSDGGSQWEAAGAGLEDPNVLSIFLDPANSWVYAGTTSMGVYRSEDQGANWSPIGPTGGQVLSVAADPTDSDIVFAGTSFGLQRTTDGGETWTLLSDGSTLAFGAFTAVAIDPSNHLVVYAGSSASGIFKSTNGGDSWGPKSSGLDSATGGKVILTIRIDPKDSDNIYLGTNGAVYRTDNGGTSWTKTSFASVGAVYGLAIDPADSSKVYASGRVGGATVVARTKDGGSNWDAQFMEPDTGTVSALWQSPTSGSTFYAATFDNGVVKGTNDGTDWKPSWTAINTGLDTTEVRALAVGPTAGSPASDRLYAGYESGSDGFVAGMQLPNEFYFPQIADGTAGRIKFKTAMVFVNTGDATTVRVQFFDSSGQPLAMRFGDAENPSAELELQMEKGGATYLQSPADPGLRVGYARITAGAGVDGTAIFTRIDAGRDPNIILYDAGVPATRAAGDFVFLLDSLGDNDTGIAIVNASEGLSDDEDPAEIELTLRDSDGFLVGTSTIALGRGEHRAAFIKELFSDPDVVEQASEMQGIVSVHCSVPLVALTLRQRDNPDLEFPAEVASLTPFPVMQPSNLGSTLYFPQVANGDFGLGSGKFQTTFFLANPGSLGTTTRVTLAFFNSDGEPMGMDLGTGGNVGSLSVDLASGQFRVYQTTGSGSPQIGYARVTASSPIIGGTGVFTQADSTQGQHLFDAGVAATLPRQKFSIFVDSIGKADTGLALVNAGTEAATVHLRLYDPDFSLISEADLTLEAAQHLPRFVFQLLPDVAQQASEMRGVLAIESDQPIAAVTLRQRSETYPLAVPTLTTFPVIAGVPTP